MSGHTLPVVDATTVAVADTSTAVTLPARTRDNPWRWAEVMTTAADADLWVNPTGGPVSEAVGATGSVFVPGRSPFSFAYPDSGIVHMMGADGSVVVNVAVFGPGDVPGGDRTGR